MKLFGYAISNTPTEDITPSSLAEVSVVASATELRAMSQFFDECAKEMDRMGDAFDHVHLGDRFKAFRDSPHFVVARDREA